MFDNPYKTFVIIKNLPIDSNNNVCLIINNTLYALSEGVCYIKAVVYETINYISKISNNIKFHMN